MNVMALSFTADPVEVISIAAGTCYGKRDVKPSRVEACYKWRHLSVFEHASATFLVEGISRACSHQLVRHRIASYSQLSQRYAKVDVGSDDWYVVPPDFERDHRAEFAEHMRACAEAYAGALGAGVKPGDARYLLPEATKTDITMTMNCREIYHFLGLRQDKAAQWEIRELASKVEEALLRIDGWRELMELRRGE